MISAFFTSALFFSTLTAQPGYKEVTTHEPTSGVIHISEWEKIPSWKTSVNGTEKIYSYERNTPALQQHIREGGAVVVFARGYDFAGFSRNSDKPLGLPFYSALPDENSVHMYNWNFEDGQDAVSIAVSMNAQIEQPFLQAKDKIQLRYFVLAPQFLKKHKLTPVALRKLRYEDLVTMTGASSK